MSTITPKELEDFLAEAMLEEAKSDKNLDYQDRFLTSEQKKRDEEITKLLEAYVGAYKEKVESAPRWRCIILVPSMLIVCFFAYALCRASRYIVTSQEVVSASNLVAFITACISFVSLIIGLLTIITKYFFPEDDEKYITTIVESIQHNDLENKRENAKNGKTNKADDGSDLM